MGFEEWYSKQETRTWKAMPWLKDELREAFMAGRKSTKLRKPKLHKALNAHTQARLCHLTLITDYQE
jgi:hypothetical protein